MKEIDIQPLGGAESDVLESLCIALREAFGVTVAVRSQAISIDSFYDERRGQYDSTAILKHLNRLGEPAHHSNPSHRRHQVQVVGVTPHDLFIQILTYVFGEAELGGTVAVVSYHRFRNELYGLSPDRSLVLKRVRKVAIHEVGHSLGLVHCSTQTCVMHAASYVEDLDLKGQEFCPLCRASIERPGHTHSPR